MLMLCPCFGPGLLHLVMFVHCSTFAASATALSSMNNQEIVRRVRLGLQVNRSSRLDFFAFYPVHIVCFSSPETVYGVCSPESRGCGSHLREGSLSPPAGSQNTVSKKSIPIMSRQEMS